LLAHVWKALEDGLAGKLDAACKHDQFNLFDGQLRECLGRAEPCIADHEDIRKRTRLEATLSSA
jgi:hypothetical protein